MTDSRRRPPPKAKAEKARLAQDSARAAKAATTAESGKPVTAAGVRGAAKVAAPRLSADGKAGFPLPKTSFRVFICPDEVHVASVSPLHLADTEFTDPDLRQTVVLRRAVSDSRTFYDWNLACRAGKKDMRPVMIALLDSPGGKPACIWQLTNVRAVSWTGPGLDAMAHEIAMEELELIYDSIVWRSGK